MHTCIHTFIHKYVGIHSFSFLFYWDQWFCSPASSTYVAILILGGIFNIISPPCHCDTQNDPFYLPTYLVPKLEITVFLFFFKKKIGRSEHRQYGSLKTFLFLSWTPTLPEKKIVKVCNSILWRGVREKLWFSPLPLLPLFESRRCETNMQSYKLRLDVAVNFATVGSGCCRKFLVKKLQWNAIHILLVFCYTVYFRFQMQVIQIELQEKRVTLYEFYWSCYIVYFYFHTDHVSRFIKTWRNMKYIYIFTLSQMSHYLAMVLLVIASAYRTEDPGFESR
jgi:hypothetical protein